MGTDRLAVGEGQHGDLRAGQKFLNDDLAAALAEDLVLHHGADGLLGLLAGLAMMTPLPRARPSALMTVGMGARVEIGERLRPCRQRPRTAAVGMPYFFMRFLEKTLLPSNDGGLGVGAEAGNAHALSSASTAPRHQRIVGRHNGEINGVVLGEGDDAVDILCADAGRTCASAAMPPLPGSGVDLSHARAFFFRLLDDGVLPSAAAYY